MLCEEKFGDSCCAICLFISLGLSKRVISSSISKNLSHTLLIVLWESLIKVFDPLSEEQIANAIVEATANRDKLVATGKTQLAKFSWEKTAQETMTVYKNLLWNLAKLSC